MELDFTKPGSITIKGATAETELRVLQMVEVGLREAKGGFVQTGSIDGVTLIIWTVS